MKIAVNELFKKCIGSLIRADFRSKLLFLSG